MTSNTENKDLKINRDVFHYKMSDNFIAFEYDNESCWIERYYMDEDNVKLFYVLLKDAIVKMKKKGIKKFLQTVDLNTWDGDLKTNKAWKLLSISTYGTVDIMCNIDDAALCIAKGFKYDKTI